MKEQYEIDKGNRITLNKEWKKIDYKNSIFPKLSTDLLEKYKERILRSNLDNYFNALFDKDVPIGNSHFGDCSITLFRTPKFYIEVIFWNSSWTSIHEMDSVELF